jgi:hypothetical protein
MGREKAGKPRRQRSALLQAAATDRVMAEQDWAKAVRHATQTPVAALTQFRHDPDLGLDDIAVDDGSGVDFTDLAVPAVLIEPQRSLMMKPLDGGPVVDGQVEAVVHAGMTRIPATGAMVRAADGWSLHLGADSQMELRLSGESGALTWSRLRGQAGPQWLETARNLGWVLCLYGPHLGVAAPGGPGQPYTLQQRQAEIAGARSTGWLAGALVAFHHA